MLRYLIVRVLSLSYRVVSISEGKKLKEKRNDEKLDHFKQNYLFFTFGLMAIYHVVHAMY